jgi:hypothetical protein
MTVNGLTVKIEEDLQQLNQESDVSSPPGESLISTISQLAPDVCADVCPESASAGVRIIRHKTLANDLSMPLRHGNLLRGCSDPVPERLHEIDLFVDREIVEPWRRSGAYLGHGKNSYDREYIVNQRSKKRTSTPRACPFVTLFPFQCLASKGMRSF